MKAYYCDHFVLPLPQGHRFPMRKYALLRQRIIETCTLSSDDLYEPEAAIDAQILLAHDVDYLEKVKSGTLTRQEIRRMGFPWSPELVERSRRSSGGTIATARTALSEGIAVNLAGGTHHAGRNHGEGFCVFNDSAIAARTMQHEGRARRILIIDCDVHQGNGTASILNGDSSIFTFSIHGEKNFPFRKVMGNLDIGLPDNTGDELYLETLEEALQRVFAVFRADLAIYVSGADPYVGDRLGKLSLTKQGLSARDHLVFEMCYDARLPVAVTMAGGYAAQVDDIVDIHLQTVQIAKAYVW